MSFPPQFLDELRERLPISQIAGRRVRLIRKGREHSALCPFHNEKTPSFTISDEKGFYHCFGCGAHGDVLSFLMRTEGVSFPDAVERLAAEAGLPVPATSPQERAQQQRHADLHGALEAACRWYQEQLAEPAGRAARDYLTGRGLDDATIARFRLGYAPRGGAGLADALKGRGVAARDLLEAGVVKVAPDGGHGAGGHGAGGQVPRSFLFDRVTFPIADRRGRVIAFGGRGLGDAQPKYLNSPDTPLFHKGRVFYGWAQARESVLQTGEVVVVEGYMDVIGLARAGIHNVVAPLGTALSEVQLLELWRVADEPALCFDGDGAGLRAALRAAERAMPLLKPGKSLRFVGLPDGEDPDSLVTTHGPAAMQAAVAGARPLVDVVWRAALAGRVLDTPERRAALRQDLRGRALAIADGAVQTQYRAEFDGRLSRLFAPPAGSGAGFGGGARVGSGEGWRRSSAAGGRARATAASVLPQSAGVEASGLAQERVVLALLINQPWLLEQYAEALSEVRLPTVQLDSMLRAIINLVGSAPELDSAVVRRHLKEHGFDEPLQLVMNPRIYRQASFAAPGAGPDVAETALHDILDWHRRQRLGADRAAAAETFAADSTQANSDRLLGIVRELAQDGWD